MLQYSNLMVNDFLFFIIDIYTIFPNIYVEGIACGNVSSRRFKWVGHFEAKF